MVSHHIPLERLIESKRKLLEAGKAGDTSAIAQLRAGIENGSLSHWYNHPGEFSKYLTNEGRQAIHDQDEALFEFVEHLIRFEEKQ